MTKQKTNYDDLALMMVAIISVMSILGLVLFIKSGLTGNYFIAEENTLPKIDVQEYKGSPAFYCKDDNAFALWTRTAADAVMKLDYSCTQSDVNEHVSCCYPPKE